MQIIRTPQGPAASDQARFSFVVVADTHINECEDASTSHFETNARANARARHVFREIAAMQPPPRFVIHLGDIVHPVPRLAAFHDAVANYREIVAPLRMPVHLVPGNHDVGDKAIEWAPSDRVTDAFLAQYRAAFGADFHCFDHGDLRFVVVNAQLFNSGLADEPAQMTWLQAVLAPQAGRRTFVFLHYPPFIYDPEERGNYDNIDEPARGQFLALVRASGVEAVFAGHVHNFWYASIGTADFYTLPSTAFMRHDFTEFYRVGPATEFGRGDLDKFGYFIVDVYDWGHVAHPVRSQGREAAKDATAPASPSRLLASPQTSGFDRVGVELRHAWMEAMQIPATGGVQDFGRKWARNDYPVLGLWEMGCRLAKVPDIDWAEAASRQRMRLLAAKGSRFIVTGLRLLGDGASRQELEACGVVGFEFNATLGEFARRRGALVEWRERSGVAVFFSKILSGDDAQFSGGKFNHAVRAGYEAAELREHRELLAGAIREGAIDGVTLRIEADGSWAATAQAAAAFAEATHGKLLLSVKLGSGSVARERTDDRANAALVARAMLLSRASSSLHVVFDTFVDVDRGYAPRHGFLDRRFAPRAAAHVFRSLSALLPRHGAIRLSEGLAGLDGAVVGFEAAGRAYRLLVGTPQALSRHLAQGDDRLFDLCTAEEIGSAQRLAPGELQVLLAGAA